jgi:hypothetical protein
MANAFDDEGTNDDVIVRAKVTDAPFFGLQ